MKILHISDFHFKSTPRLIIKQKAITDNIINFCANIQIDLVIFTGDLVQSGEKYSSFVDASKYLFNKIISELKISKDRIIICQGNHDINRSPDVVSKSVLDRFLGLKDNNTIAEEIISNDKDFKTSLDPSSNYLKFSKYYFNDEDIRNELYSSHIRIIDNIKWGCVSINTAWLAQKNDVRGSLLYPTDKLFEAVSTITECKYNIALLHHPLHCLKEFNKKELEDIIYDNFHFVFIGDSHKSENMVRFSSKGGNIVLSSPATLVYGKDNIGFSIIDFDTKTEEIILNTYSQDKDNNINELDPIQIEFPRDEERKLQNKLRKVLRNHYEVELNICDGMFNISRSEEIGVFHKIFTSPCLKSKSETDILIFDDPSNSISFDNLKDFKNNYFIIGKEKSGRTSILRKIQLDLLSNYERDSIIPIFIPLYHKTKFVKINIDECIVNVLKSFTNKERLNIIKKNKLLLIIDDFDIADVDTIDAITEYLNAHTNSKAIISVDETFHSSHNLFNINIEYEKIFIFNVTRKQIRELTKKTLDIADNEIDSLMDRIIDTFKQFSIPLSYWNVSMFLWIAKRNKHYAALDNSDFIENYIDQLIDKEYLSNSRNDTFKFYDYKELLANIAYALYTKYEDDDYSAPIEDIKECIKNFIDEDIRRTGDTEHIYGYLLHKYILRKNIIAKIGFSVKADFEYFLAYFMTLSKNNFKNDVLKDESLYLSFKNELELYSGIVKCDKELLKEIYEFTKNKLNDLTIIYPDDNSFDLLLSPIIEQDNFQIEENTNVNNEIESDDLSEEIDHNPMSPAENDDVSDGIDNLEFTNHSVKIKKKEKHDINKKDYLTFEKLLFMLSRIYRNMGKIQDNELSFEIFEYILKSYIRLGFLLDNEFKEFKKEFKKDEEEGKFNKIELKKIKKFLSNTTTLYNYIPLITQINLYYGIGHSNISKIIDNRISDIFENTGGKEYYCFILSLLKVDIDIYSNYSEIENILEKIKNKKLLHSLLSKITYYYIYKSYSDSNLQKNLKKYYKSTFEKLQTKTDRLVIGDKLQELDKKLLLSKSN